MQTDDCIELKNIKYKTLLLNGNVIESSKTDNASNLEDILEKEAMQNRKESWTKMDKTTKASKIIEFSDRYAKENNLENSEKEKLCKFLIESLDKKKLQKVKEVVYDKKTMNIISIPGLQYNKPTKHFTLKICEKRVSTLKCLTPKKPVL